MAMVFELDKLDIVDLPQMDYGPEYRAYTDALREGLEDPERREFYLTSLLYSGYIEQLLSRIGVVSIKQIATTLLLNTLLKGLFLVAGVVVLLFTALVWFQAETKPYQISITLFLSPMAVLLFIEFGVHIYRYVNEELDFVEQDHQ